MLKKYFAVFIFALLSGVLAAQINCSPSRTSKGDFALIGGGRAARIFVDASEPACVKKAAELFAKDLRLLGASSADVSELPPSGSDIVVIASLGNSKFVDSLVSQKKLDISNLSGAWERFAIKTIDNPAPGISRALLIVGSDRRGAAYGTFSVSEAAGVSPLYWWADVPVKKYRDLFIKPLSYVSPGPSVKYRGLFINDEGWGLHKWAKETFEPEVKGIGPKTYEKVCELILRLKGNMLAPAMHPCSKAFYSIPENKRVADAYGVIITTSHCEPLLFNNVSEWHRDSMGEWNYLKNRDGILSALDSRVAEAAEYENIYTVGLRGLHDSRMESAGGKEVEVLEGIIKEQREILAKYIEKPADKIPQIFVPYKETLDIYEKSMKLPDDVTLVWPDDNYGYIKRLSNSAERKRSGGAGVYYHLSYLGGPHDYLWLCTTPPVLMYEELKKACDFGADRYWLLNVGDIKPMELGMLSFFDLAWDINTADKVPVNSFQAKYLAKIFGAKYEAKIQFILDEFYRLAWSRKPEFMGWEREWDAPKWRDLQNTDYSFENYNDARRRLADYRKISDMCSEILDSLPEECGPAFFEMVGYPVMASSRINEKFLLAQLSRELRAAGRSAEANWAASRAREAHEQIERLNSQYNGLLGGKWRGMMMLAPGWCAKYHMMPELAYDESAGEKAVDVNPDRAQDRLEKCAVLDLKKFSDKIALKGHSMRELEGIGYDWNAIQLGRGAEAAGDPTDLKGSRFEYEFSAPDAESVKVHIYTLATFPSNGEYGSKFGVSVDGGEAIVVENKFKEFSEAWKNQVLQNGVHNVLEFDLKPARGKHKIAFICGDPGIVIQRVVIDWGGLKKTYVGPSAKLK